MLVVAGVTMVSYVISGVITTVAEIGRYIEVVVWCIHTSGLFTLCLNLSWVPLPCCRTGTDSSWLLRRCYSFLSIICFLKTRWHQLIAGCSAKILGMVWLGWYLVNGCSRFPVCDSGVFEACDLTWMSTRGLYLCNEIFAFDSFLNSSGCVSRQPGQTYSSSFRNGH